MTDETTSGDPGTVVTIMTRSYLVIEFAPDGSSVAINGANVTPFQFLGLAGMLQTEGEWMRAMERQNTARQGLVLPGGAVMPMDHMRKRKS